MNPKTPSRGEKGAAMSRNTVIFPLLVFCLLGLSCEGDTNYYITGSEDKGPEVASQCTQMTNNKVLNCGFESNTDHWETLQGTTLTRETIEVHSGAGAGKIANPRGSGVGADLYTECASLGTFSKSVPAKLGLWLKTPNGSNSYPTCVAALLVTDSLPCDGEGRELISVDAFPNPDDWIHVQADAVISEMNVSLYFTLVLECVGDAPLNVLVDDISLIPGAQGQSSCSSTSECQNDFYCDLLGRCECADTGCVCSDTVCENLYGYNGYCEHGFDACTYDCSNGRTNCIEASCSELGLCDCVNGHCACTEDLDCASATVCKNEGRCHCINGLCGCVSDEECRGTVLCTDLNYCYCVHGLCREQSQQAVPEPIRLDTGSHIKIQKEESPE